MGEMSIRRPDMGTAVQPRAVDGAAPSTVAKSKLAPQREAPAPTDHLSRVRSHAPGASPTTLPKPTTPQQGLGASPRHPRAKPETKDLDGLIADYNRFQGNKAVLSQELSAIQDQHVVGRDAGASSLEAMQALQDRFGVTSAVDGKTLKVQSGETTIASVPVADARDVDAWATNLTTIGDAVARDRAVPRAAVQEVLKGGVVRNLDPHSRYEPEYQQPALPSNTG